MQDWQPVFFGTSLQLQQHGLKEKVWAYAGLHFTSCEAIATNLKLIWWQTCIGVMIWLLAIIYFISGVPGAYVLWYRPLYNAMRLCIFFFLDTIHAHCHIVSSFVSHIDLLKCLLQDWKCFEVWVVFLVLLGKMIIISYIRLKSCFTPC